MDKSNRLIYNKVVVPVSEQAKAEQLLLDITKSIEELSNLCKLPRHRETHQKKPLTLEDFIDNCIKKLH